MLIHVQWAVSLSAIQLRRKIWTWSQIDCFSHNHTVEMAQYISFNLSIPNTECNIPNGQTVLTSQWVPTIWTKVTMDGKSQVASSMVQYVNFPPVLTHQFQPIMWQPVRLRQTHRLTEGPVQPYELQMVLLHHNYGQNSLCISAFRVAGERGRVQNVKNVWHWQYASLIHSLSDCGSFSVCEHANCV